MENNPIGDPKEGCVSGTMPEIYQFIDDLARRLNRFQEYTLKESRLTLPQYYILTLLSEKDCRPLKELADELGYTRAAITGIVDTMEKKALVTRNPNRDDRRSILIEMTEDGRSLLQSTPGVEKMFSDCCCNVLPTDEGLELNRLLKKLSDSLPF
jgi:DNA-binding MarR family transcriptional regulator